MKGNLKRRSRDRLAIQKYSMYLKREMIARDPFKGVSHIKREFFQVDLNRKCIMEDDLVSAYKYYLKIRSKSERS